MISVHSEVWFTARKFSCPVCYLRLDSQAELEAAGIEARWKVEKLYEPRQSLFEDGTDEDAFYERYREELEGS